MTPICVALRNNWKENWGAQLRSDAHVCTVNIEVCSCKLYGINVSLALTQFDWLLVWSAWRIWRSRVRSRLRNLFIEFQRHRAWHSTSTMNHLITSHIYIDTTKINDSKCNLAHIILTQNSLLKGRVNPPCFVLGMAWRKPSRQTLYQLRYMSRTWGKASSWSHLHWQGWSQPWLLWDVVWCGRAW